MTSIVKFRRCYTPSRGLKQRRPQVKTPQLANTKVVGGGDLEHLSVYLSA